MIEIQRLKLHIIQVNCYLIKSKNAAVVIDPGFYSSEIVDFLNDNSDKTRMILLTHAHFDHIGAAKRIATETDTEIAIGEYDSAWLSDNKSNLSERFHIKLSPFSADFNLKDNQVITVGDMKIKVLHTPGHTPGSVCYLIEDNLFSGDTLFLESYGRTDFFGGNDSDMMQSIYFLITTLDKSVNVYPGHGEKTTIDHESKNNPMVFRSTL